MSEKTEQQEHDDYMTLTDEQRALYDEAGQCGATHDDAMDAAMSNTHDAAIHAAHRARKTRERNDVREQIKRERDERAARFAAMSDDERDAHTARLVEQLTPRQRRCVYEIEHSDALEECGRIATHSVRSEPGEPEFDVCDEHRAEFMKWTHPHGQSIALDVDRHVVAEMSGVGTHYTISTTDVDVFNVNVSSGPITEFESCWSSFVEACVHVAALITVEISDELSGSEYEAASSAVLALTAARKLVTRRQETQERRMGDALVRQSGTRSVEQSYEIVSCAHDVALEAHCEQCARDLR